MASTQVLSQEFYLQEDVVHLAQVLLGKILVTHLDSQYACAMITETEAYKGPWDKASHAYGGRLTQRTQTLYQPGGVAYIYLCYGIHSLFNVVTGPKGIPHAVLIRALEPLEGIEIMQKRRQLNHFSTKLTCGPGRLSQALGINVHMDGVCLTQAPIWLEDKGVRFNSKDIVASPRIGVGYAREHATLPWRYTLKGSKWTSA